MVVEGYTQHQAVNLQNNQQLQQGAPQGQLTPQHHQSLQHHLGRDLGLRPHEYSQAVELANKEPNILNMMPPDCELLYHYLLLY